jgi:energy-coupling factor transporter ATP-binding protein EcfA2
MSRRLEQPQWHRFRPRRRREGLSQRRAHGEEHRSSGPVPDPCRTAREYRPRSVARDPRGRCRTFEPRHDRTGQHDRGQAWRRSWPSRRKRCSSTGSRSTRIARSRPSRNALHHPDNAQDEKMLEEQLTRFKQSHDRMRCGHRARRRRPFGFAPPRARRPAVATEGGVDDRGSFDLTAARPAGAHAPMLFDEAALTREGLAPTGRGPHPADCLRRAGARGPGAERGQRLVAHGPAMPARDPAQPPRKDPRRRGTRGDGGAGRLRSIFVLYADCGTGLEPDQSGRAPNVRHRQLEVNEMVQTVFRTENLRKTYDTGEVQVHALAGVDLELYAGELAVLLGASGSGKSTLLNILGGLDHASAGRVWFRDLELTDAARPGADPLPARPCRLRLPVLQPRPLPQRARERAACHRCRPEPDAARRGARHGGSRPPARPFPGGAFGRRAAARRHRARHRQAARGAALRRAHGRARQQDRRAGAGGAEGDQRHLGTSTWSSPTTRASGPWRIG